MVAMSEATVPALDAETEAALTLFNEYVVADRERTQREKRIKKAERAKTDAANHLKKVGEKGSAEEKAEAEKAYRSAVDAWKALKEGKEPEATEEPAPEATEEPAPEATEEAAPEATEEPAPEATDDATPETATED
jgi:hypothetical protein